MKITLVNLLLFLTSTLHAAFYVDNQNVMAEIQTYQKGNKKIVLIDMIHIGPKRFYKGVKDTISKHDVQKSIILQEGVTHCSEKGDELILPTVNANFEILETLFAQRHLLDIEDAKVKVAEAGFKSIVCQTTPSHEEPNVLDRFKTRFSLYGLIAGLGLMRSQGSLIVYPQEHKRESGDIAASRFVNPIMKALAASVVECLLSIKTQPHCANFKTWSETESGKEIVDEFVLKIRNDVLLAKTLASLGEKVMLTDAYNFKLSETNYENIILPWGAAHMPGGLTKSLEDAGFVKNAKVQGIHYATCKNVGINPILGMIFSDQEAVKNTCL